MNDTNDTDNTNPNDTNGPSDASGPMWTGTRHDVTSDEMLDLELAALLALDAIDDAERSAAEDVVDALQLKRLHEVATVLADATATPPPADLRQTILDAARARRSPGSPLSDAMAMTPAEAFRRTVDDLHRLLVDLSDAEWLTPSLPAYGGTRDLIAHLVGIEEGLLGLLGDGVPPDPDDWNDHVTATASTVAELREVPTSALADRWVRAAHRLAVVGAGAVADAPIAVNDLPTTVRGMFILRTFEVWTHHEDVCRATGRPMPVLDGARLRLMSTELMDVLPITFAMTGSEQPGRTIRLVLTGAGGGTYVQAMAVGSSVGDPDVTITIDVVDLCRVASRRLDPWDLDVLIEGDQLLGQIALAAASALARD